MAQTTVKSEQIATNAISGTIIADNAITGVHIAQNAILTQHIDDGQVGTSQLAADAVTGAKLADSSVVTANIQDDQVTGDKLTNNITIAGALTSTGAFSALGGAVFNENSADVDFRVESNNEANAFVVNGGDDTVLIGTAVSDGTAGITPRFQIEGTSKATGTMSITRNSNDVYGPHLVFNKTRGTTVNSDTIVQDNDYLGVIAFGGADGTDRNSQGAAIHALVGGTPGADDLPGELLFLTTADGANGVTERMRIMANGKIGIGTSSPAVPLDVRGNVNITADDARLLIEEADGTDITWVGDITGAGVGGCFLYNHGGTATVQLRADATSSFINNGASFGIGTSSPAANLHVYSAGQAIARVEGANQYYSGLMIRNNYSSTQSQWHVAAAGGSSGWGAANGNFIIRDDTTNSTAIEAEMGAGGSTGAIYIKNNGTVGIGVAPVNGQSAVPGLQIKGGDDVSYTATGFNSESTVSLSTSANTQNRYASIRFTHVGNTEGFFGYVRTSSSSDISDFVWQGYDGNSNSYKEYFRIAANGDLTGIDTSIGSNSDKRLKKNINDYTGGLTLISKLKPKTFEWKVPAQRKEGTIRGFVAQDILAEDDYWINELEAKDTKDPEYEFTKDTEKVYTSKLSDKDAMYVSAIKELITRLETAEAKIAVLEG